MSAACVCVLKPNMGSWLQCAQLPVRDYADKIRDTRQEQEAEEEICGSLQEERENNLA